ncbi:DUF3515 domain-containing protein [Nocardioides marmorisolisilvae]|uniref:DUF3515 domain-containing protein n=1 Tax=Nocardioides marmorisolisilvae TaxID=1542737 RepID=A0A3N0DW91_9ACTN|nr:DUF3515 domain-containing protein [Nocardioides marmorisolisilvae]RNL79877.1 DUF3515 domain-containing protein [Nocardioides marmorisolisilvae]
MPGRPHLRPALGLALAALLASLLSACGNGAVEIDRFKVTAAGHESCQALLDALPTRVADQHRRRTSGSTFGAAWGSKPIVLRCGVGKPADYDKFSGCQTANGVDWFVPDAIMEDQDADVVMTTIGRSPAVEVRVPSSYRPATAPMVDLAKAIKAHTREISPCS